MGGSKLTPQSDLELAVKFSQQAAEFRALKRMFETTSRQEPKHLLLIGVCHGLAVVCEGLAVNAERSAKKARRT